MTRVLVTAFEPYDTWTENASWLALVELTRNVPRQPEIVTRRYPVDFEGVVEQLEKDLAADFDYSVHLGQSPGATGIQLEALAVNVRCDARRKTDGQRPLAGDGPVAYQCPLPLDAWAARLQAHDIPASVSYHAGTYVCNALLYYANYLAQKTGRHTRSAFIHVPLAPSQAIAAGQPWAVMPPALSARAVSILLAELAD